MCKKCGARAQRSPAGITIICIPCWRVEDNCNCETANDEELRADRWNTGDID